MLRTAETPDSPLVAPDRLPEPTGGPVLLTAQRGLFFGPTALAPEDLYSVVERGAARRERGRVTLTPGSKVGTNTYFGRFSATYWQRWTAVDRVEVTAVAAGEGRVRLLASDTNKVARIVDSVEVGTAAGAETREIRLTGPVDRFLDGGGMWLELTTELGTMTVSEVHWKVRAPRSVPVTDVVICTYNRVEECLDTLQALVDDPEALAVVGLVRVVDQGSDPLESRERFSAVSAALGDKLVYLRQPNLGGAGGFTRGLFEATAGAPEEHRDVLFMDDDVMLEPEILFRLTSFGACTQVPTIVGGQMLNLLHPGHLHISAEYADPENLLVGLPTPGALQEAYLLGLDERLLPINQERRADTEYNGWWSCLIPASIVRAIGYPLPLFFQWDDIEFGYRARREGFPTVSLPGAGVWHGDFGWKDWDEWHRYFNLRNGLIMAALHTGFSTKKITARIRHLLSVYLIGMHYGLSATLLQAVEDFLQGPEILRDGSADAAAMIRRVRADYPETKVHKMADLPDDFRDLTVVRSGGEPSSDRLTWVKRAVYQAAGKAVHRTGFIPAGDAHWWHVALFERAVVTDMGETGVRIRTRDKDRAVALAKRGFEAIRRLRAEGPAVVERYRAAVPELTSRENWARLYNVES
ncbi:glycosyltransferase [Pseudonocardia pini]|uniref:glycosyltransferase n=1 Tax=Pseudonocardia pini TaxID=2758030 RepID=UPI0015F0BF4F|nr:glycosyltransferase [Pseudonocardia pini]